jgi:hypothetical protein
LRRHVGKMIGAPRQVLPVIRCPCRHNRIPLHHDLLFPILQLLGIRRKRSRAVTPTSWLPAETTDMGEPERRIRHVPEVKR